MTPVTRWQSLMEKAEMNRSARHLECSLWITFRLAARTLVVVFAILLSSSAARAQDETPSEWLYPLDVAAADDGTLYVADRKLPGVWKVKDGKREIFFQADKKYETPLNAIRCLGFDKDGNLLAGDSATRMVYRFGADGKPTPIHSGQIQVPMGIATDADGNVYVSDTRLGFICKIPPAEGETLPELERVTQVAAPRGLAFDDTGRLLIVSAGANHLLGMSPAGEVETIVEGQPFKYPATVAFSQGSIYVVDSYADTVFKVVPGEAPTPFAQGAPFEHPVGISASSQGLYVADPRALQIFSISEDGQLSPVGQE